MSIGRARDFGIQIVKAVDAISKLSGKEIEEMEVSMMFQDYGDIIFEKITGILNWLFCYKNSDYIEVSQEWVAENIAVRMLVEIVKEIARQNQLSWLIPFFQDRFQTALKVVKS